MWIAESQPMAYRFALFLTGDPDAANDVAQEALRIALTKESVPAEPVENGMWLRAIVRNVARQHRRARGRAWMLFDSDIVSAAEERFIQSGGAAGDAWEARKAALAGCLKKLSEPARELVRDRYERRRKVGEIAMTARTDANTISKRLERVRRALRECIERKAREVSNG